jgi:nitroreductase
VDDDALFAVITRQRACRQYRDTPVDDATVERLLTAATYAPSAENHQPWVFVVVRNATARAEIAGSMQRAWETAGRAYSETRLTPAVLGDVDRGMTGGFAGAPVFIVVAGDAQRSAKPTLPSSIFPAVQNMLLTATALGLGSALTTIATVHAGELARIVALPEHLVPLAVVPVGYPVHPLAPPRREPFSEHTHRERFGNPW